MRNVERSEGQPTKNIEISEGQPMRNIERSEGQPTKNIEISEGQPMRNIVLHYTTKITKTLFKNLDVSWLFCYFDQQVNLKLIHILKL